MSFIVAGFAKALGKRCRLRLAPLWILILVLDAVALFGLSRMTYDDGLVKAFQSDSARFQDFDRFQAAFPRQGRELLILLESGSFSEPDRLFAVADLVLELQLADGVDGIASAFAIPDPAQSRGFVSLVPDAPIDQRQLAENLKSARDRHPDMARFLSSELDALLVIVQLTEDAARKPMWAITRIKDIAAPILQGTGVSMTQTGYLVMRQEVLPRLFSDFVMLTLTGGLIGTLIATLAMGSLLLGALTMISSGTALLWVVGALGLSGVGINVITVSLPVLILVLSFADSLHLGLEILKQMRSGQRDAVLRAVGRIAPACAMASATTAIAFGVLALSPSALVSEMGLAGMISTALAFAAVLVVHPLLLATVNRHWPAGLASQQRANRFEMVTRLFEVLPDIALRRTGLICVLTIAVTSGSVLLYIAAPTNFSLFETLQKDDPTLEALARIETQLTPIGTLHFPINIAPSSWKETTRNAHDILERSIGREAVSMAGFEGQLDIDEIPPGLKQRFVSDDGKAALITVPFRYQDAKQTRRIVTAIEAAIDRDPEAAEVFSQGATGLETMSSFVSAEMLHSMSRGFLIAIATSGLLVAVWLRSLTAGLIALIPNMLPIALVGAWLAITQHGLEFSSGIALTIAFGLAVDDTVHVLNRLRLNLGGRILAKSDQIVSAVKEVLPALVITSTVLSFGLMGTQMAELPSVAHFGALSMAAFVLALVADLVVLPACLILVSNVRNKSDNP